MSQQNATDSGSQRIVLTNPYPWDMPQPKRPGDCWVHVCGGHVVVTRTDGTWNGGSDPDEARQQIDAAIRAGAFAWVVGHPNDGSDDLLETLGGRGVHLGPDHPMASGSTPGMTPLMLAAATGDRDEIRNLIIGGADIDAANALHHTALHHAAATGDPEAVDLLLAAGADPDRLDLAGTRPRRLALLHGDWRTAAHLDMSADTTSWRDALTGGTAGDPHIDVAGSAGATDPADPTAGPVAPGAAPTTLRSGTTELRYDGTALRIPRRFRRDIDARIADTSFIAAVAMPHLRLSDFGPGVEKRPWRAVLAHPSGRRLGRPQLVDAHIPGPLADELLGHGDRILTFEFSSDTEMRLIAEMATTIAMHGGTVHRSLDAAHTQIGADVGLEAFL